MYNTGQYDYQMLQQLQQINSKLESVLSKLNVLDTITSVSLLTLAVTFGILCVYVLMKWVKNK